MSTKEKLQIAQKVESIGQEWKRISKELNNQFSPSECQSIFESISMDKPIKVIVNYLQEVYRKELLSKLGEIELEYSQVTKKSKLDELTNSKKSTKQGKNDMDTTDIYLTESSRTELDSKRALNNSSWQKTANMIWQKLADHRAGPLFLKPIKNENYSKVIRQPMFLDTVKSRIRSRMIKTTPEFHRDVMQVLANAVMYNPDDENLQQVALELMHYTDTEMQNFLILHPQE